MTFVAEYNITGENYNYNPDSDNYTPTADGEIVWHTLEKLYRWTISMKVKI